MTEQRREQEFHEGWTMAERNEPLPREASQPKRDGYQDSRYLNYGPPHRSPRSALVGYGARA